MLICIGDIHGRSFWKDSVDKYKHEVDRIIFLGDYVDSYQNENITRKEAIQALEDVISFKKNNKDKTILLLGNHKIISLNF